MPSIKSILTDIQTLPLNQIEELLSYLEEFLVLGSQVEQVCEEVKEFRFAKGKVCPHCSSELISRMVNIMESKDISVKIVERLLLILQTLQHIEVRNL